MIWIASMGNQKVISKDGYLMNIQDTDILNPRELAHHILGRVLEWSGEVPLDDMTVLVAGLWSKA